MFHHQISVLIVYVRVLSHLPHLVGLNRTSLFSLLVRLGRVRMHQSHQKRTKQSIPPSRGVSVRFSSGSFVVENAIRPQTDPNAKRKPSALVSCAVHYGMRRCL